jgi:hypothetical protein
VCVCVLYKHTHTQRRRFELLTKLEKGVPADLKRYPGAADVKWENLVRRMAIFALDRSRSLTKDTDPDDHDGQETCAIIFRLLKDHLIKARTWPLNEQGDRVRDANGAKVIMIIIKLEVRDV